jgi:tetratricopeptide (TPR) repeat protein
MESALKYFRHALSLHLLAPESNQEYIATEYNNIAAILIEQGDLEEAVVCLQRTLDIKLKVLPSNHPNLAHAYYSLAMSYYALDRYDEMFDYMQKALTIDKQSLPENHPQTQFHEENMKAALKRMLERIATGSIIVDDN